LTGAAAALAFVVAEAEADVVEVLDTVIAAVDEPDAAVAPEDPDEVAEVLEEPADVAEVEVLETEEDALAVPKRLELPSTPFWRLLGAELPLVEAAALL